MALGKSDKTPVLNPYLISYFVLIFFPTIMLIIIIDQCLQERKKYVTSFICSLRYHLNLMYFFKIDCPIRLNIFFLNQIEIYTSYFCSQAEAKQNRLQSEARMRLNRLQSEARKLLNRLQSEARMRLNRLQSEVMNYIF